MRPNSYISFFIKLTLVFTVAASCSSIVAAQDKAADKAVAKEKKYREFCSNDSYNSDRAGFRELREMTVPASGNLTVGGGRNGGIRVRGENRSDVLVRACVQTWADTDADAKALASSVRISSGSEIRAEGPEQRENNNWGVSFEILTPRNTNLDLSTTNGGISISTVDGRIQFATTNGGVSLSEVGGEVKGRTTNGGIKVDLAGATWKGTGVDVQTTNGGINLSMPQNYGANIEVSTTNGGFRSDIPGIQPEKKADHDYSRATRVNTSLNGGGALIRLVTTNGGVTINSTDRRASY